MVPLTGINLLDYSILSYYLQIILSILHHFFFDFGCILWKNQKGEGHLRCRMAGKKRTICLVEVI